MKQLLLLPAVAATAVFSAPVAHAQPAQGDLCYSWRATIQGSNGQTLICTHLLDSGHLMYWETSQRD